MWEKLYNWVCFLTRVCCCSVAKSCLASQTYELLYPRVCSNPCLLSGWCHPTISSSVASFSSCHRSLWSLHCLLYGPTLTSVHDYWKNHSLDYRDLCWQSDISVFSYDVSVQFSQSYPTICNPMDCSMPGLPVHHQLPEPAQTHVHQVGDAIKPSHLLSSPSPPAFNLSQHQGLFQWVSSSHHVPKVLELQLEHQSFQWIFRTDFL